MLLTMPSWRKWLEASRLLARGMIEALKPIADYLRAAEMMIEINTLIFVFLLVPYSTPYISTVA